MNHRFCLSPEHLNAISPFYFVFGETLLLEEMGAAISKVYPNLKSGTKLNEFLTLVRSSHSLSFDSFCGNSGDLYVFEFKNPALQLKGQCLYFSEPRKVVFIGTPAIMDMKQLTDLGLTFRDFAIHDSAVDYLFLLQSLQTALAEAKRFSEELALRTEKEKQGLAKFPEESPNPIMRIDLEGHIIYANSASEPLLRFWGIKREEHLPPLWKTQLASNTRFYWSTEVEVQCENETYALMPIPIQEAGYINIYGRNITNQRKVEADLELSRAQTIASAKLVALGEMAGGIAHEVNSPLAVINTLSSQLQELVDEKALDSTYLKEVAKEIESTTLKIAKIINGLRAFSRESTHDPFLSIPLKTIVDDTLAFCSERFKLRSVFLSVDNIPAELKIECHSSAISQVLLNLLNNALDAVDSLSEKWVKISSRDLGDHVELTVIDSGSGIPPEVVAKLFQPFFTTKAVGKGTGLGLGISKRIIENHNGQLSVDSESKNTRFVILLPKLQSVVVKKAAT